METAAKNGLWNGNFAKKNSRFNCCRRQNILPGKQQLPLVSLSSKAMLRKKKDNLWLSHKKGARNRPSGKWNYLRAIRKNLLCQMPNHLA